MLNTNDATGVKITYTMTTDGLGEIPVDAVMIELERLIRERYPDAETEIVVKAENLLQDKIIAEFENGDWSGENEVEKSLEGYAERAWENCIRNA